ncbi:hypothetical protein [Halapricum desulfuricans]|uniref:hypothetical protein n=1 Tax=Halapricum desulfuricans TaxID=2841257 RepID=UPI001E33AD03|nr:hypothetical protein [Halapricum desulfuricans]
MNLTKIAGIALAVVLVAGGTAAALPGNAPTDGPTTDQPNATPDADDANETTAEVESERGPPADRGPHASDDRGPNADHDRGPPTDMPEQVPDFVTEIHETINQFLDGELEGDLGSSIAEITPDDGDSDEQTDADDTVES